MIPSMALWTPKGIITVRDLAMVTCYLPTNRDPNQWQVKSAVEGMLTDQIEDLPASEKMDLAGMLEAGMESEASLARLLVDRSIVSQTLARVDWARQKPQQPPPKEVEQLRKQLTVLDYLDSAMTMR